MRTAEPHTPKREQWLQSRILFALLVVGQQFNHLAHAHVRSFIVSNHQSVHTIAQLPRPPPRAQCWFPLITRITVVQELPGVGAILTDHLLPPLADIVLSYLLLEECTLYDRATSAYNLHHLSLSSADSQFLREDRCAVCFLRVYTGKGYPALDLNHEVDILDDVDVVAKGFTLQHVPQYHRIRENTTCLDLSVKGMDRDQLECTLCWRFNAGQYQSSSWLWLHNKQWGGSPVCITLRWIEKD